MMRTHRFQNMTLATGTVPYAQWDRHYNTIDLTLSAWFEHAGIAVQRSGRRLYKALRKGALAPIWSVHPQTRALHRFQDWVPWSPNPDTPVELRNHPLWAAGLHEYIRAVGDGRVVLRNVGDTLRATLRAGVAQVDALPAPDKHDYTTSRHREESPTGYSWVEVCGPTSAKPPAGPAPPSAETPTGHMADPSDSLAGLLQAADAACTAACDELLDPGGNPFVWLDLSCADAERYQRADGTRGLRVYIEEASPDARALQTFIRNHLAEHGYPDVDVVTRW